METSQLMCIANQLTGFYMNGALAQYGLGSKKFEVKTTNEASFHGKELQTVLLIIRYIFQFSVKVRSNLIN